MRVTMNKRSIIIQIPVLLLFFGILNGQVYEWRGPDRNGIIPETGLLKSWPEKGPEMIWSYQGLGEGHTSTGPGKDRFFITGLQDGTGILYAFDYDGKLLWKKPYGPEWTESYPGPRSTPVVINDLVYFQSGHGMVYCYNVNSGDKVWSVDLQKKFGGRQITWGMTECLLIRDEIPESYGRRAAFFASCYLQRQIVREAWECTDGI
jgi:hypothetical protein